MKHSILLAAIALLVMASCSQEEMSVRQDQGLLPQESVAHISKDRARSRLSKVLAATSSVSTRALPSSIDEGIALGKNQKPLTRGDEDEAWYYYFTINNGEQFAIMGAKPEMPDLLAIGNGTPSWEDETSLVPNPERWDIGNLVPIDTTPQIAVPDSIITVYGDMYFPHPVGSTPTYLCPVTWDQDKPFNKFCIDTKTMPGIKANAGCVPLAVLQMFAAEGVRPVGYKDFLIDWDLLLSCPTKQSMLENDSASDHAARLMMILGNEDNLDVTYSYDGAYLSTAYHGDVIRTLRNFGFCKPGENKYFDSSLLNAELDRGYPVIMSGLANGEDVGHEFLVHGMIRGYRDVYRYSSSTGQMQPEHEVEMFYFYQVNWGWGGRSDGYYIEHGFRPGHSDSLNPDGNPPYTDQEKYDYTYYRRMIVGVQKTNEK